jgi:hypothetical protein
MELVGVGEVAGGSSSVVIGLRTSDADLPLREHDPSGLWNDEQA